MEKPLLKSYKLVVPWPKGYNNWLFYFKELAISIGNVTGYLLIWFAYMVIASILLSKNYLSKTKATKV
jgi:hypothetical protein